MTRERPILFSGPLVRAILEGRKTQTRRVLTPQPYQPGNPGYWSWPKSKKIGYCWYEGETNPPVELCPYGQPGDRLWVRERQRVAEIDEFDPHPLGVRVRYEADGQESSLLPYPGRLKGKPVVGKCLSYGGYRESSRIQMEVTGIRVERVQDITEADAQSEGVDLGPWPSWSVAFAELWDQINAKRGFSWDANPWVWVVEFPRIEPQLGGHR